MEEPKTKQEKNGMAIKLTAGAGCVSGIGGIVFLGGAFVAATLVSVFVFKRRVIKTEQGKSSSDDNDDITIRQSPPPPEIVTDDDHHNQITKGLTVLIPADSSRNEDEDLSTENPLVLGEGVKLQVEDDEKFDVACDSNGVREVEFEKVEEVSDVEVIKECDFVQEDRYLEDADEVVKGLEKVEKDNESRSLIEEEELSEEPILDESLVLDSGKVPQSIEAEKTPHVESSDGEEPEDNDEESSEGTEGLSTESNYDSVWPADSIQVLETNNQTTEEGNTCGNDDNIDKVDEKVETIRSYAREVANQRSTETWTWLMLALLWCLCQWYLGLPFVKVSILTMVISIVVLFGFPNHVLVKHK